MINKFSRGMMLVEVICYTVTVSLLLTLFLDFINISMIENRRLLENISTQIKIL